MSHTVHVLEWKKKELSLNHLSNTLDGVFKMNGELYKAQTILAWGFVNAPHYRYLIKKM